MKLTARSILAGLSASMAFASGESTNDAGQPVQSFVKDLIRVGEYVKASTDQELSVTRDDLAHWVETFNAMNKAGVKVPVPLDHSGNAEHNRGYCTSMFVVGDTLYGRIELVGRDAIDMAGRTEVSISVVPELTDGSGNKHTRAIEHVALTSYPVIPGQGGFIALSRDGKDHKVPVYRLSNTKDMSMEAIAKALGIDPAGKAPEDLNKAIMEKIAAMNAELSKGKEAAEKATTEAATAKAELARVKAAADKGEKKSDAPHPTVIKLAAKSRSLEIAALVSEGKISQKVADKLTSAFIGKDNVALARTIDGDGEALFDETLAALRELQPRLQKGQAVKTQTQHLSRETPGDGPTPAPELNPELEARKAEWRKAAAPTK